MLSRVLPLIVLSVGIARGASAQLPSLGVRSIIGRVTEDADAKGYHHPQEPGGMIPALAGGVPHVKAPLHSAFTEGQIRRRTCSSEERRRYHPCVRADVLSMLAYDSTGDQVALSVIPQSFLGDSLGDAFEVPASREVVADAEVIARGYQAAVLRVPVPSPSDSGGLAAGDSASVVRPLSSDAALGLARMEATKQGYRMGGEPVRLLQSFLALGPSPAVTGWQDLSPMLRKRECTPEQAAAHPHCVRIEWLEIFYGPAPFAKTAQAGVIPHTYVGTGAGDVAEIEADSEVVAVAGAVAVRSEGRVVHAIPWQTPVPAAGAH